MARPDEELALVIGEQTRALNENLREAWRRGLCVDACFSSGRGRAVEKLAQASVLVYRPLHTEEVSDQDRADPRGAVARAIGG